MLSKRLKDYRWRHIIIPLFLGLSFFSYLADELKENLLLQLDGVIINEKTSCDEKFNNKCISKYRVKNSLTGDIYNLKGTFRDTDISVRMPVGTELKKNKWELIYYKNGDTVYMSLGYYFFLGIMILFCVGYVFFQIRKIVSLIVGRNPE